MKAPHESKAMHHRPPAVAGQFYPQNAVELRCMIEGMLQRVETDAHPSPKALIAPHAGYVYSGLVAASAYASLARARAVICRVVLLGPAHHLSFRGLATTSTAQWATPLGEIPVDMDAVEHLRALPQVSILDAAHAKEHSIEVHLPFLQVMLREFAIVPLLAGAVGEVEVAEALEALWGGEETLLVISSDLSHYHSYATARALDSATARAIEDLRPADIGSEQACGWITVRGLLRAAQHRRLRVRLLDLRNSGDTAGSREPVVGYGAWAFEEPDMA